jgi:hypothetical protein
MFKMEIAYLWITTVIISLIIINIFWKGDPVNEVQTDDKSIKKSAIISFLKHHGYKTSPIKTSSVCNYAYIKFLHYDHFPCDTFIKITLKQWYLLVSTTNTPNFDVIHLYESIDIITEKIILAEHKYRAMLTQIILGEKLCLVEKEVKLIKKLLSCVNLKESPTPITSNAISLVHLTEDLF